MSSTIKLPPGDYKINTNYVDDTTHVFDLNTGKEYCFDTALSEAALGISSKRQTATQVRMQQDASFQKLQPYQQVLQAAMDKIAHDVLMGASAMAMIKEFPPRFLHVHRDLMQQMFYSHGNAFQIKAHFTQGVKNTVNGDPNLVIGVRAIDNGKTVDFRPYDTEDVQMADCWEDQFKSLPDEAIELLRKAVTPT